MIQILVSALLASTAQAAGLAKTSMDPGLISTSQMTVRAVVLDHCTVSPAGATCEGVAPIRPVADARTRGAKRISIVF